MVAVIIIPIIIVAIIGLSGFFLYRFFIFDYLCKRSVNKTLKKYKIKKSAFQIIKEFYGNKGEHLSENEIKNIEKNYRQKEPEQFLTMYDSIRDSQKKD